LTAIVAAVACALGASGCGVVGEGLEAKVSKTIQEEKELDTIPAAARKKYADCLAAAAVKYGNKDDVKAYVDGRKQADDIRGMDRAAAKAAVNKCAERVPK